MLTARAIVGLLMIAALAGCGKPAERTDAQAVTTSTPTDQGQVPEPSRPNPTHATVTLAYAQGPDQGDVTLRLETPPEGYIVLWAATTFNAPLAALDQPTAFDTADQGAREHPSVFRPIGTTESAQPVHQATPSALFILSARSSNGTTYTHVALDTENRTWVYAERDATTWRLTASEQARDAANTTTRTMLRLEVP